LSERSASIVIAGLVPIVPAIHVFVTSKEVVDARVKPARDDETERPLQRLALQQPRHLAGKACGLPDEQAFQRRRAVDQSEADIAHGAQ
jgi:hypothetical protein